MNEAEDHKNALDENRWVSVLALQQDHNKLRFYPCPNAVLILAALWERFSLPGLCSQVFLINRGSASVVWTTQWPGFPGTPFNPFVPLIFLVFDVQL